MPRLASVTIRRFKRLKELTFDVSPVTVLIGANNAGKSSVLQAIHFAVSLAQSARLVGEGVRWKNDTFELSLNPASLLYAPVSDVFSLATDRPWREGEEPTTVTLTMDDGATCTVAVGRGRNRNISVEIRGRALGDDLMSLDQPFSVYAPGLAGIARTETYLSPGIVRRIVARGDANLVLRNVLRMLHDDPRRWATFTADMQTIFPGLQLWVEFAEQTDEHVQAFVRLPRTPRLPLEAAGTSVLQAAQLLCYIGLFAPKVLILDEPDSHLHPNNQRALCRLIAHLAETRGFQALISTHSRHVFDEMRTRGEILWLREGTLETVVDESSVVEWLLDLGALDAADYFATGALRCVVLTEDGDTKLLKELLVANGFPEREVAVESYRGCRNVAAAQLLGSFLKERAPNLTIIVHRDRDYLPDGDVQEWEASFQKHGLIPFVTRYSDVEGYFLNAAHLAELNQDLTLERATELLDTATAETQGPSIGAIVEQRLSHAQARRGKQLASGASAENVNAGAITTAALTEYPQDPVQMRRGKIVLKQLMPALQKTLRTNPAVVQASSHLAEPELQSIAAKLWPNGTAGGSAPSAGLKTASPRGQPRRAQPGPVPPPATSPTTVPSSAAPPIPEAEPPGDAPAEDRAGEPA